MSIITQKMDCKNSELLYSEMLSNNLEDKFVKESRQDCDILCYLTLNKNNLTKLEQM